MTNETIKYENLDFNKLASYSLDELHSLLSQPEYKKIATKIWLVILMINRDKFLEELQKLDMGLYKECEEFQQEKVAEVSSRKKEDFGPTM